MSTQEWERLMRAPWGKHTPEAIASKREAMDIYGEVTKAFWERRNMSVPTLPNDDRSSGQLTPIESWVPRLAPAFAEYANDVRAIGRLGEGSPH